MRGSQPFSDADAPWTQNSWPGGELYLLDTCPQSSPITFKREMLH